MTTDTKAALLIILGGLAIIAFFLVRSIQKEKVRRQRRMRTWEDARAARLKWMKEQKDIYLFLNPNYQELWGIELAAAAYLWLMDEIDTGSYTSYQQEETPAAEK
jgi:hypothetical protein